MNKRASFFFVITIHTLRFCLYLSKEFIFSHLKYSRIGNAKKKAKSSNGNSSNKLHEFFDTCWNLTYFHISHTHKNTYKESLSHSVTENHTYAWSKRSRTAPTLSHVYTNTHEHIWSNTFNCYAELLAVVRRCILIYLLH